MKIKEFLLKYWPQLLLAIIVLVIGIINFVPGKYLISNDNYSPELNPSLTIERSLLSPAWRSYRGLGVPSDSEQADVIRAGLFKLGGYFIGEEDLKQIFNISMLLVGSLFIGLLSSSLISIKLPDSVSKKNISDITFIASGVFYITSLWVVWLYYQNIAPYIVNFGIFPLVLYVSFKYINNPSFRCLLLLLISSLLLTPVAVVSTLFIVDFVFYVLFLVFFVFYIGRLSFKNSIIAIFRTLGVFLSVHLFWILPLLYYTYVAQFSITDSYVNRTITSSVIDLERGMQTFENTLRFYTRALNESSDSFLFFPASQNYLKLDLLKIIAYIPIFFSILSVVFAIYKKNLKLVAFSLFIILSVLLINLDNPPFGRIFAWMQESIPLFKQIFRWPSSKVNGILLVSISILGGIGFGYFSSLFELGKKRKFFNSALIASLVFALISVQFLFSNYLFKGDLFPNQAIVNIPDEYFELGRYLKKNDSNSRIYYFPPSNNNYFREYNWGFYGSQFISYIVPNPILDLSHTVGSSEGENLMLSLSNIVRANDKNSFKRLLIQHDVRYLLVDRSINPNGFTFTLNLNDASNLWNDFDLVWERGYLELYEIGRDNMSPSYIEADVYNTSLSNMNNYFKRNLGRTSEIPILSQLYRDAVYSNNHLVSRYIYSGNTTDYSFEINSNDLPKYPTLFTLRGNSIIAEPSIPVIQNAKVQSPIKIYNTDLLYSYYSVNGIVVSQLDLRNGVSSVNPYVSNHIVQGIKNNPDYIYNLLPSLSGASAADCSGGTQGSDVKVENIAPATGFTIKSSASLPCVYTSLPVESEEDFVIDLKINWESDRGNFPGYCLYSEIEKKCLNKDKFLTSDKSFKEISVRVPNLISRFDKVSLIFYALNSSSTEDPIIFKKFEVSVFKSSPNFPLVHEDKSTFKSTIKLEKGNEYLVRVPIIKDGNTYQYTGSNSLVDSIWQPNSLVRVANFGFESGMKQSVRKGFANQSITIFKPNPLHKYLVYFEGSNISNIPASICITYVVDSKCWFQEIFTANQINSRVSAFVSSKSLESDLNVILSSYSYSLKSENILNSLIVMEIPGIWHDVVYTPAKINNNVRYNVVEMNRAGKSSHSTSFVYNREVGHPISHTIISIPEAHSSGWLAFIKSNEGWSVLGEQNRVSINGWKQGWDVSELNFSQMRVIFWPNLLAYYGYLLILTELAIVFSLVIKSRKKYEKST